MENRAIYNNDETTIDLAQLFFYVLKKWKRIFLFVLIGILIGVSFVFIKGEKTIDDLEMDDLHLEQITQYHDFQQLYKQQLETDADSVIMQMNPNAVYSHSRTFSVTLRREDYNLLAQEYSTILQNNENLKKLIEASGLDCNERAIRQLVGIGLSRIDRPTSLMEDVLGTGSAHAKLGLSVNAPTEEMRTVLIDTLTTLVEEIQEKLEANFKDYSIQSEPMTDYHTFGYSASIHDAQLESAGALQSYVEVIADLKKSLSEDDLFYYSEVLAPEVEKEQEDETLSLIKWAILGGALFAFAAAGIYAVLFLLNGSVKTLSELRDEFGLYTVAYLDQSAPKKKDWVEKLVDRDELPLNTREYLLEALQTLEADKLLLSGDDKQAAIAELLNWINEQNVSVEIQGKLTDTNSALAAAKTADGIVLFVQLWNTQKKDLIRELEIAACLKTPVKGIVVLKA